jgi:hypothetical protein
VKTDELIDNLSNTLAPVSPRAVAMQLAEGALAGALVSFVLMWVWLGIRPDLMGAMATSAYWMKFFYTLLLAALAYWATERLARPGGAARRAMVGAAIVFAVLFAMAAMQWMRAAPEARMPLVMGHSSHVCPWRIIALSLPIFAGTFWSLSRLAPTRLVTAGIVAGVASGALGAWIYAFHCDESAAPFVLVFYTLSIAVIGAAGAFAAGRFLRW